jgi:hypothetical protein
MSHDNYPTLKAYVAKIEAMPFVQSGNKKLEALYKK